MRKMRFLLVPLILWLGTSFPVQVFNPDASPGILVDALSSISENPNGSMPGSCTSFTVEKGETLLFGNNEDYKDPNTYLWVEPSAEDQYGGIYLGYQEGQPQGGINEKGLAFDGLALPPAQFHWDPELPSAGRYTTAFWGKILRSCANVEEAIQMASRYNWGRSICHQIIIADASGDSAVLSASSDGSLAVTRKSVADGFLVATNFNLANPENTEGGYPCPRYETATAMLNKVQEQGTLSIESVRDILDAVHQEGSTNNTLYSNIFDLRNGVVYLYYWHQYSEVVSLDIKEEITKGASITPVRELFSVDTQATAELEYLRYQSKVPLVGEWVSWGWLGLSVFCLLGLLVGLRRQEGVPVLFKLSWVLPVFFLGPLGLLVYWFSFRKPQRNHGESAYQWLNALGASTLSTAGFMTTFVFLFGYFFYLHKNGSLGLFAVLIPFAAGLLVFRSPWTAAVTRRKYLDVVRRVVLVELISTLISVGVFIAANTFILDELGDFYAKTLDPGNGLFWGMFTIYSLVVGATIIPFHGWLASRGILVWPVGNLEVSGESPESQPMMSLRLRQGWIPLLAGIGLVVLSVVFLA